MTPEQLANALKQTEETKDVETQVKEAIDELKEEIESEESVTEDPATEPECDSTEEPKPTIMDEYVQFEEIPKE
jgi:gas vesicle protein